ncbi:MAG: hypothetical protein IBX69_05655 [Anaerolineales bacterium]|nr:hypothetical protein [Anaerolineales bacterium]
MAERFRTYFYEAGSVEIRELIELTAVPVAQMADEIYGRIQKLAHTE